MMMKNALLWWTLLFEALAVAAADSAHPTAKRLRKAYHVDANHTTISNNKPIHNNDLDDNSAWGRLLLDEEADDNDASLLWQSMSMSFAQPEEPSCVAPEAPEFVFENDTNIGDTLWHPGPGYTVSCGPHCLVMQDSGDDPPFDPDLGDTLRFAYRRVTSDAFVLQSRVCGLGCADPSTVGIMGRAGLMVRESLDPLARNLFVSHTPNFQADWSWRSEYNGTTVYSSDGSPDVECLWIALERAGSEFAYYYAYEGPTDSCEQEALYDLSRVVTMDMPETVYVGFAVSSLIAPPSCQYTTAGFYDIECRGC